MMNNRLGIALAAALAVVVLASMSLFTVDQRERAIVFQLGEVKEVITTPGLHFKWPLIQNVRYFDARILTLDTPDAERYITSEKKNLLVDSFVKWQITDVRQYYISVGDEAQAQTRISQTVNATLREEFGKHTVHEVVSEDRNEIMKTVRERANQDAKKIGVEIIDVRLKRVDLPQEVSESVYKRMDAGEEERGQPAALGRLGRGRTHPRRGGQGARGDHRQRLQGRAARQGRGRRQGGGGVRAGIRPEPGVLRLLPQPRSLPLELQEPQ